MTKLYGIPNCSTVRKARSWLSEHGIAYLFVDFKHTPPDAGLVSGWLADIPADILINRRGTTWRSLDDAAKAQAETTPAELLAAHPMLAKRPVLVHDGRAYCGFAAEHYAEIFGTQEAA